MDERLVAVLQTHWDALHALLFRLTLRQDVAEDLLQELYLKLDAAEGFTVAANPAGYAHRTAVNLAMDWRQRQRRVRNDVHSPADVQAIDPQLIERLIDAERIRRILDALINVPELSRRAFVMRHVEQRTYDEIARELGKTAHQARAMTHDAVRILRGRLAANED